MKKSLFIAAIILSCLSFKIANAQVQVSLGINIGSQPDWGPVGYDHASYYYMPDIDAYYDVPAHQYIYYNNNTWVRNSVLPSRYNFDRYNSYKVVVNEPSPWRHNDRIRERYASYRGHSGQGVIRDSRDARYKNHWKGEGNRGNPGRGYGNRDRGDRGHGGQPQGDRGHGGQPQGDRGHGGQPQVDRGHGGQPRGDRGHGGQPQGDKGRGGEGHGHGH
ncbi:MAG: hypothetical protein ACXVJD_07825 [Mucilaginibacter sp.]